MAVPRVVAAYRSVVSAGWFVSLTGVLGLGETTAGKKDYFAQDEGNASGEEGVVGVQDIPLPISPRDSLRVRDEKEEEEMSDGHGHEREGLTRRPQQRLVMSYGNFLFYHSVFGLHITEEIVETFRLEYCDSTGKPQHKLYIALLSININGGPSLSM
ncbi:hypothetical protein FOCC_FOCC009644 [Frankliniella occidentalis]|nr:hypothetical protein FOCC_FOCC009644 [Frankliniella occidentalis]